VVSFLHTAAKSAWQQDGCCGITKNARASEGSDAGKFDTQIVAIASRRAGLPVEHQMRHAAAAMPA